MVTNRTESRLHVNRDAKVVCTCDALAVPKAKNHLTPLDIQPGRVLVIAAHPGDIEWSASAAVAKWTKNGAEVMYLVATRGELSMPGIEPADAALIRSGEQSAAAAAVSVSRVEFLDIDDGAVEATVRLRRSIVSDIRRFRPDVVLTLNHREREADGTWNDPDHRAIGTAALDAVISAGNQWAFRDIGKPHSVGTVLIAASPDPTHAIDVSGFEEIAVGALMAHEQHFESVTDHPMTNSAWLTDVLKAGAERLPDSAAAITVEQIPYAEGRPCHSFVVKDFEDAGGQVQFMNLSDTKEAAKKSTRARNATAPARSAKRGSRREKAKSDVQPQPQQPQPQQPQAQVATTNAMKLKVRLEKSGRSIGVEVPASAMGRLGDERRPAVVVEIGETTFETTVGTNNERRFIAINAERRKAAGIDVDDEFFMALTSKADADRAEAAIAAAAAEVAPVEESSSQGPTKRKRRRKRPSNPRR